MGTHRLEHAPIRLVRDPVLQRNIHRKPPPLPPPPIQQLPRPGKELPKLMQRKRHDPISRIERLLDPVAVVAVDVDVEHARDAPEELEDAEHDVVDVAEARGFALFGVVEAAGPVYGDVGFAVG